MKLRPGPRRIVAAEASDPVAGAIHWAPVKSIWITSMTAAALLLGPIYFSWSALLLFLLTTGLTLCAGHSVGMHRRLIHASFECPRWVEYCCVYLGTLVGMAGPIGMIRLHDMRDWAQRQQDCHDFFAHRGGFWRDGWHQLHCEVHLRRPPAFVLEPRIAGSRFYQLLERSWMWQQLPWALLFFAAGGMPWVVWGICARVAVGVTGHWLVGHFAHLEGEQSWIVEGACVQGYDVRLAGFISMGESWHNNHHAFPGSARLGIEPGQVDLGWLMIVALERLGLARDVMLPGDLPERSELRRVAASVPATRMAVGGH